jgi:hypothetical protein
MATSRRTSCSDEDDAQINKELRHRAHWRRAVNQWHRRIRQKRLERRLHGTDDASIPRVPTLTTLLQAMNPAAAIEYYNQNRKMSSASSDRNIAGAVAPSTSADAIQIDRTLDAAIESGHGSSMMNSGNGGAVAASAVHTHARPRFQLSTIRDDSQESSDEDDEVR